MIKASEEEFLFGAGKPLFLSIRRFHFLSEATWETVTYAFIFSLSYCLFSFLFNPHISTLCNNSSENSGKNYNYFFFRVKETSIFVSGNPFFTHQKRKKNQTNEFKNFIPHINIKHPSLTNQESSTNLKKKLDSH